jgi:glucose-fructose oxidoreductase
MSINRRSFIKTASYLVGGLTIAPPIACSPKEEIESPIKKTKRKYGVALVGLGYYSSDVLAPALQETKNCYLAGIVTGTPEKEKIWSEKYNLKQENIYNYSNFDSIKNNPEIDYVYIVLPNSMHKEYTIRGALAGKHVLCEKPMALNAEECREMIEVCKSENRKLSIGYRMHYDLATRRIMEMAKEKPYGQVKYVHAGAGFTAPPHMYDNWRFDKELGGGAIMDMGVYSIQAARYSIGAEPIALISAQDITYDKDNYNDVDQGMIFQLEFPDNIYANLMTSFACSINELSVTAERGWYRLKPFSGYRGVKGESKKGPITFPSINQQAAHMDDFAYSIESDTTPLVTGDEGLKDMIVVDSIREFLQNKERVELKI